MKRKISECPKELEDLIDSVNLVPGDLEKFESDLLELSKQFNTELYGKDNPTKTRMAKLLSEYGKKIRNLISPELEKRIKYTVEQNGFENVVFQLRRLVNERIMFRDIIQAFRMWDIDYNRQPYGIDAELFKLFTKDFDYDRQLVLKPTFNFSKALSAFSFNQDTSIELLSFRVLEILTRDKIPIERLRICPICKDIFWAKRIEAKTCSKRRCSNNFHQRKLRIKEYEKRLDKEFKNLKKLQSSLSPKNSLITQQRERVNKLLQKIKKEKMKNGNL